MLDELPWASSCVCPSCRTSCPCGSQAGLPVPSLREGPFLAPGSLWAHSPRRGAVPSGRGPMSPYQCSLPWGCSGGISQISISQAQWVLGCSWLLVLGSPTIPAFPAPPLRLTQGHRPPEGPHSLKYSSRQSPGCDHTCWRAGSDQTPGRVGTAGHCLQGPRELIACHTPVSGSASSETPSGDGVYWGAAVSLNAHPSGSRKGISCACGHSAEATGQLQGHIAIAV